MKILAPRAQTLRNSLFDNTLDGLAYCQMVFDKQGNPVDFTYIEVNKNFEKLTGLKGVVGKRATEILPGIAMSSPELFEIYGKVSLTGESKRFEIYAESLSKWFFVSVYSPKKKFFVTVFQNITDRKKIEINLENAKIAARNVLEDLQTEKERLAEAKAKDEAMLASIGDGVIIVDLIGKITFMNEAAQQALGWKGTEVIGKLLFDVVPIEDEKGGMVSANARPMVLALAAGTALAEERKEHAVSPAKTTSGTYYYVRKDKTTFPVAMNFSRVMLEGKIVGAIEVFRDITKETELDRAKSEFVSLASHQLRTPLSAVRWYSGMLLDGDVGKLTEKQEEYVEEISHGNLRMIELVNALLNISQIELGTLEIKTEEVNVGRVVRDVVHDIESRAKKQGVQVSVKISDDLPHAMLDPKLVRMLIENLVVNAIKYTPKKGAVLVEIFEVKEGDVFEGHRADSRSVSLSVTDTGIGIPDSQKKYIFSKLFRADNARAIDTDGTGLGLYLAKRVAEYCKGELWFESQEGLGSRFFGLFPLSPPASSAGGDRVLARSLSG